jgi:hypothetical protein
MYTIEHGSFGRRAVVRSPVNQSMINELLNCDVHEIELNIAKGWRGDDLGFLCKFPKLMAFYILDLSIKNIEPIHCLGGLRRLEVTTYCKTDINFSVFPRLEICSLEWRSGASSIYSCSTLVDLFLNRYSGGDLQQFSKLNKLEVLGILNSSTVSLAGLSNLKQVRSLRLGGLKKLVSLMGVSELDRLEELDVNTCRSIKSISEISGLKKLKKLALVNCGDIESLKPLDGLCELETVLFYDSTNIVDGDLSPLFRQKKLARVAFENRRHYSARREDFGHIFSR